MANTISELEAERAKILEEIENKAKSMSSSESSEHSLQDWLKAASEVVPESALQAERNVTETPRERDEAASNPYAFSEPQPSAQIASKRLNTDPYMRASDELNSSVKDPAPEDDLESVRLSLRSAGASSQTSTPPNASGFSDSARPQTPSNSGEKPSNRSMVAGVAISLTLLLTTLGVVVVGYNSVHKELLAVSDSNDKNLAKIEDLQSQLKQLPLSAEASLSTASDNQEKIRSLQNQLVTLESQITQLKTQLKQYQTDKDVQSEELSASENGITEKLTEVVQKLQKLESSQLGADGKKPFIKPFQTPVKVAVGDDAIAQPIAPTEPSISEPIADQQLISLVEKQAADAAKVKTPVEPKKNYTADVKWLMQQPAEHYILQLASMYDEKSLQRMIKDREIKDAKIIPQERNGKLGYVLVTGSFADRNEVDALSRTIKKETGISPWRRKVGDLVKRID
ncbi:SPOR domain-containing protein [Thiomicrorhabdus sp. 6S3-12]|uniref:SPOR domain-containing protein n=1 Tax=Thiomicrorhabdus sp. 6S3-12 TaxID=2819681 RepID=UPI001AADE51B|nr:SPOR domain-containing protein [Thiomicrorhabdus sp. 6S3-12]MBO1925139.1 SPOR domain-containing protein [Thiomicrorhabdus sp. 6S3-12]